MLAWYCATTDVLGFGHWVQTNLSINIIENRLNMQFYHYLFAILSANMFHQGLWQRIYSVTDKKSLIKSFVISSIIVIPVVFIFGFIGIGFILLIALLIF